MRRKRYGKGHDVLDDYRTNTAVTLLPGQGQPTYTRTKLVVGCPCARDGLPAT
jgi:hypothetical protein